MIKVTKETRTTEYEYAPEEFRERLGLPAGTSILSIGIPVYTAGNVIVHVAGTRTRELTEEAENGSR